MLGNGNALDAWAERILSVRTTSPSPVTWLQTFNSVMSSVAVFPGGGTLGLGPGALSLAFAEVVSFGSSCVYSMNSGFPGMYFRSTSGTRTP